MQRWLDALHPFTLMIKKPLPQIINCYIVRVCAHKPHKEKIFAPLRSVYIANKLSFIGMFLW